MKKALTAACAVTTLPAEPGRSFGSGYRAAAAKEGDMMAARLVLDRIAPPCRGRPVRLGLPPIVSASYVVRTLAFVADAMARGVLSAEEAQAADHHRKAVETLDLERSIAAIEAKHAPLTLLS